MKVPPLIFFIASTFKDLWEFRDAAKEVITNLGHIAEDVGPLEGLNPEQVIAECTRRVASSDAMVFIVGRRRGWVPTTSQLSDEVGSITVLELETAKRANLPILPFAIVVDNSAKLRNEDLDELHWVLNLRRNIQDHGLVGTVEWDVRTFKDFFARYLRAFVENQRS